MKTVPTKRNLPLESGCSLPFSAEAAKDKIFLIPISCVGICVTELSRMSTFFSPIVVSENTRASPPKRNKGLSDNKRTCSTAGSPLVRVPVLSKTTAETLLVLSKASPPLMRTPCFAPTPDPTMTCIDMKESIIREK